MNKFLSVVVFLLLCISAKAQVNSNIDFRSHLPYPVILSNLWGYVDDLGNEYALVGTETGVSIVDVTDPDHPAERFYVPSPKSEWREIKTFNKHAYATNEKDSGILIIDLSNLPASITHNQFSSHGLLTAHTLWIDENGILYAFGFNFSLLGPTGGVMMFDLNSDPDNPQYISQYSGSYIHDGFVRGDTLWAAEVYQGQLAILNVKNKNNFQELGKKTTPLSYCHNSWPTSDNRYVFTTDERPNSTLTSYDVTQTKNISAVLDQAQSNPGSNSCIHNVHLLSDDFAVCSYYTDGIVIFNVTHPDNIIQVGNYDTSPLSGSGFKGAWGVYPFLPSGNLIVSDIEEGLFVLTPHYRHPGWLEGTVRDSVTTAVLNNVTVKILSIGLGTSSNYLGSYKTGSATPGLFDVQFSKSGYLTRIIRNVNLESGVTTSLNVKLFPSSLINYSITVLDSSTYLPVPFAGVFISDNAQFSNTYSTNGSGAATLSQIYKNTYDVYVGAWGYQTVKVPFQQLDQPDGNKVVKIGRDYYDDFLLDLGWQKSATALRGSWVRVNPIGTYDFATLVNPANDVTDDFGDLCFVTGNGNGFPGVNDVDSGFVFISSPSMDLTSYDDPYIQYYRWFGNISTTEFPPDDSLKVILSNGIESKIIEWVLGESSDDMFRWVFNNIRVKDYLALTDNMKIEFVTGDSPFSGDQSQVEAGIDKFQVTGSNTLHVSEISSETNINNLSLLPNPFNLSSEIRYHIQDGTEDKQLLISDMTGRILFIEYLKSNSGRITIGNNLEQGLYFILLRANNKNLKTVKAIKF